jgi:hypothetical protein
MRQRQIQPDPRQACRAIYAADSAPALAAILYELEETDKQFSTSRRLLDEVQVHEAINEMASRVRLANWNTLLRSTSHSIRHSDAKTNESPGASTDREDAAALVYSE